MSFVDQGKENLREGEIVAVAERILNVQGVSFLFPAQLINPSSCLHAQYFALIKLNLKLKPIYSYFQFSLHPNIFK